MCERSQSKNRVAKIPSCRQNQRRASEQGRQRELDAADALRKTQQRGLVMISVKIPCTLERASRSSIAAIRTRLTRAQRYDGGAAISVSIDVIAPPLCPAATIRQNCRSRMRFSHW